MDTIWRFFNIIQVWRLTAWENEKLNIVDTMFVDGSF